MPGVKGGSGTRQSRGPALRGGQHSRGLPGRLTKGASPRAVYDLRQVLAGLLLLGGDHGAHLGRAGQGAGEVSPTAGAHGQEPHLCLVPGRRREAWGIGRGPTAILPPDALVGTTPGPSAPPLTCHQPRTPARDQPPARLPCPPPAGLP